MTKAMVVAAALIVTVSPALADNGRIACQIEVRDFANAVQAKYQGQVPRELTEHIQVINNQCRFATELAGANMTGLRSRLGVTGAGSQTAIMPLGSESLHAYD